MFTWMKNTWASFEAWVNTWFPGMKTYITTGLGTVASVAAVMQDYITGLPLTQFIEAKTLALVSAGLFTLSFWFKGIGDRVDAREAAVEVKQAKKKSKK